MSIFTYMSGVSKRWFPSNWGGGAQGVFDMQDAKREGDLFQTMSQSAAMKLSAVYCCVSTRGETVGQMPIHLRDKKNQDVTSHPLYEVLHDLPNAYMTTNDYVSMSCAQVDLSGNQISLIVRNQRTKVVKAINPIPDEVGYEFRLNPSTNRPEYVINGESYDPDDVLHMRGFSLDGVNGLSRLAVGRNILSAQYQADTATMRAIKQGLKVGGFFETTGHQDMSDEQFNTFMRRMAMFSDPESQSKWMPLPPNMKPVTTGNFKISPVDAELLNSRYFGIEEICRLFNTPPPLIGHTSKASSWASSAEQLNLHYLIYSIMPTLLRREKTYWHKLLTPDERRKYHVKHSLETLMRVDMKTLQAFFASGLQNGYLSQNEVRAILDRVGIGPEGDVYRIQLNMSKAEENSDDTPKPKE